MSPPNSPPPVKLEPVEEKRVGSKAKLIVLGIAIICLGAVLNGFVGMFLVARFFTEKQKSNNSPTTATQKQVRDPERERIHQILQAYEMGDLEIPETARKKPISANALDRVMEDRKRETAKLEQYVEELKLKTRQTPTESFLIDDKLVSTHFPKGIKLLTRIVARDFWITKIDMSPDGKWLAILRLDGMLMICSAETGERFDSFVDLDGASSNTEIKFSSDGKLLVIGYENGKCRILDLQGNGRLNLADEFKPHRFKVTAIAISEDKKYIATGSEDSSIRLYSVQEKKLLWHDDQFGGQVNSIQFVNDSNQLIATDTNSIRSLKIEDGTTMTEVRLAGYSHRKYTAFSHDSKFLAAGVGNLAEIYDTNSGKLVSSVSCPNIIEKIEFTSNGQHICMGTYQRFVVGDWRKSSISFSLSVGQVGHASSFAISKDQKRIAVVNSRTMEIKVFEVSKW